MLFGNDEQVVIKGFMNKIEANIEKGMNSIRHSLLLYLTIEDYHHRQDIRKDNDSNKEEETSNNNKGNISGDSDFFSEDYPNIDDDQLLQPISNDYPLVKEPIQKDELFSYSNDYQYPQDKEIEKGNGAGAGAGNESFYLSLISFYQKEAKSNGHQTDQMHKSLITDLLYTYIQTKEIHIFFSKLFTYDSTDPLIESKLSQIKQLILTKISLLINIISSSDKQSWFTSLKISSSPKNESETHFDFLNNLFINITSYSSIALIPENSVEKFCSELLMTNELISQITKVIENNF